VLTLQQSEQYKRQRPETTLLYQLVERYYPDMMDSSLLRHLCAMIEFDKTIKTGEDQNEYYNNRPRHSKTSISCSMLQ
jgi:hypothetical protein